VLQGLDIEVRLLLCASEITAIEGEAETWKGTPGNLFELEAAAREQIPLTWYLRRRLWAEEVPGQLVQLLVEAEQVGRKLRGGIVIE